MFLEKKKFTYQNFWLAIVSRFFKKCLITLSGCKQQEMQYSYILQHPVSLHVSQAKRFVFSEFVLQQPDDITSDLEHI